MRRLFVGTAALLLSASVSFGQSSEPPVPTKEELADVREILSDLQKLCSEATSTADPPCQSHNFVSKIYLDAAARLAASILHVDPPQ